MSHAPKQLVVFGGQGSGKGTQAVRLADTFDVQHIGAGDILRRIAKEGTPLGQKVAEILGAGQFVPDDLILEIVTLQLKSLPADRGFVLEGYPRSVVQSEEFRAALERLGRPPGQTVFVYLDVPRDVLVRRMQDRKRHDDTEELITERLRLYDERTAPVLQAVESWAQVLHVNGNQSIEAVTDEIVNRLSSAKAQA
jgi:adenylate kinase